MLGEEGEKECKRMLCMVDLWLNFCLLYTSDAADEL